MSALQIKTYQRKKEPMSMETCSEVELSNEKEVLSAWKLHLEQVRNQQKNLSVELLWRVLCALEQDFFYTVKGISFTFIIRGHEMFVNRKEKSITQATVGLAAQRVLEKQAQGMVITGPKKIGTFGASYLYPIFQQIGLINGENLYE